MPVDLKELREAIDEAIRWMTMDENGTLYKRVSPKVATLQAFLDSGLTDDERETVGKDAATVRDMLELGDSRLLASDGDAGGQLPDLSPAEWGKVYRACKRIAALAPIAEGKEKRP